MASRFYGLDVGEQKESVAEGSSTGSKDVEIQIDLAATNISRQAIFNAVAEIMKAVREDDFPPA